MRNRRFLFGGLIIIAVLGYLIYGGMRQAIVYFKTPSEVKAEPLNKSKGKSLRIGGMVVAGTLQRDPKALTYRFQLSDGTTSIPVYFHGIPPDLFAEGKGAVVEGRLGDDGVFIASGIMAKHAEEYKPPEKGKEAYTHTFIPGQDAKKP